MGWWVGGRIGGRGYIDIERKRKRAKGQIKKRRPLKREENNSLAIV